MKERIIRENFGEVSHNLKVSESVTWRKDEINMGREILEYVRTLKCKVHI